LFSLIVQVACSFCVAAKPSDQPLVTFFLIFLFPLLLLTFNHRQASTFSLPFQFVCVLPVVSELRCLELSRLFDCCSGVFPFFSVHFLFFPPGLLRFLLLTKVFFSPISFFPVGWKTFLHHCLDLCSFFPKLFPPIEGFVCLPLYFLFKNLIYSASSFSLPISSFPPLGCHCYGKVRLYRSGPSYLVPQIIFHLSPPFLFFLSPLLFM